MSQQQVKEYIASLEADNAYLRNEREDILRPNKALAEISEIALDMFADVSAFEAKKGKTESSIKSKERLLKILFANTDLNSLLNQNVSLKLMNRDLLAKNQNLVNKIMELSRKLKMISDGESFEVE